MNFSILCNFFDQIKACKTPSDKSTSTREFMQTLRDENPLESMFEILRLIIPKLDRERPAYRIKESKISKLLISMLGLPPGPDRNLVSKSVTTSSGQFGDVISSILKKYVIARNNDSLTVTQMNSYLDKIANRTSDSGLDDLVLEIFKTLSPQSTKWFIQIILKDLKLGINDNTILNCYHQDGASAYATNSNLRSVLETFYDPDKKLHELEIKLFEAFKPMLSKRCDSGNFRRCFPESRPIYLVENKFDGERFQLHMENNTFRYFSRNGFDFTKTYGASFTEGNFTPQLTQVFSPETHSVILDGEMMLWNRNTANFGSKGMHLDVKKLGKGKYQPCFCVYDILLWNGRVLTNLPLHKRQQYLSKVITMPIIGTIVISEFREVHSQTEIIQALNTSVDNNEEGIIVKDPKSIYKCSDRNSGWYKVKLDYFEDVVHDLDVLLMGGSYGSHRKITSFFVGISSGPNTYLSLGRIGSGLKASQIDDLTEKLQNSGLDFNNFASKSQGKLQFGRDTPDIYIEPQNSTVLQIRASELIRTTSDAVKTPYTLRFPRVLQIRNDKPVEDCLNINELLELTNSNKAVIKLNKGYLELGEIKVSKRKRAKLDVRKFEETKKGDFLQNWSFHVMSDTAEWGIESVYHTIENSGGNIVYLLGQKRVDFVLVGTINERVSNLIKQSNQFDLVHLGWLKRCVDASKLLEYKTEELLNPGCNYRGTFSNCDHFGDSYEEEVTKESLERTFRLIEQRGDFFNTNETLTI